MTSSGRPFAILVALSVVFGFVAAGPPGGFALPGADTDAASASGPETLDGAVLDETGNVVAGGPAGGSTGPGAAAQDAAGRQLECAGGRNGGATDKGVTPNRIKVAATAVLDGPAASLLSTSPTGMKAVIDKVNQSGGICGRGIDLTVVNDGFDPQRGQQFIRNFIDQDYFALTVVPSAEGLSAAINSKDISRAQIPVVGSDGMRIDQYREPWVWPVATATVSTMRVMATYAYQQKEARSFAIVWDSKYKFGVEGAEAFKAQIRELGGKIVSDRPLDPDQPSYASEAQAFNESCRDGACDVVALLLLPDTAKKWMATRPVAATKYTSGAQTLFTDRFAQDCVQVAGTLCNEISVWTGYNPPIGRLAATPGVNAYVSDVKALDPSIDVRNQFLQGAYLGMNVFVEALTRTGPNLTRQRLKETLDSMDMQSDLSAPLQWRPGKHHANVRARAFAMVVSQGTFSGWRDEQTGWVMDPALGR